MVAKTRHVVGTSGYSFRDWVGNFYPAGTQQRDMFGLYVQHFEMVELNFTYYRMPTADIMPGWDHHVDVMREAGLDRGAFFGEVWLPLLRRLGVDRRELPRRRDASDQVGS